MATPLDALPGFNQSFAITQDGARPSQLAANWWTAMLNGTRQALNAQQNQITALQQTQAQILALTTQINTALQQAAQAQATADAGGGTTAKSGQNTSALNPNGSTWILGPVVALTGVVAGNLTVTGSGPYQLSSTTIDDFGQFSGNWRIMEIIGGVETGVFLGTYIAVHNTPPEQADSGVLYQLYNQTDTTSFSLARTSTGAVSYRLDINLPGTDATQVGIYIYVRRA